MPCFRNWKRERNLPRPARRVVGRAEIPTQARCGVQASARPLPQADPACWPSFRPPFLPCLRGSLALTCSLCPQHLPYRPRLDVPHGTRPPAAATGARAAAPHGQPDGHRVPRRAAQRRGRGPGAGGDVEVQPDLPAGPRGEWAAGPQGRQTGLRCPVPSGLAGGVLLPCK